MQHCIETLRVKEVINKKDGCRLGRVCDVEIDVCTGQVACLIVCRGGKWLRCGCDNDLHIPWCDVDVVGDLTGTDLGLVNEDDFVTTPTGKTDGIEIVTPVGTPTSPIVLSEIDDSAAMKYSTVHTSSNDYINHKLDAINESLVGKLSIQFVAALPASPTRNTQYYVETADEGVWDIYVVDDVRGGQFMIPAVAEFVKEIVTEGEREGVYVSLIEGMRE